MRKYFIAGVVAMVAFAMAAFAATLTVDGGVIQAGSDEDLTCTTTVTVTNYGVETDDDSVRFAKLSGLEPCVGEKVIIQFMDTSDVEIHKVTDLIEATDLDGDDLYRVNFPSPYPTAESFGAVNVWIHSGS